MKKLIALATALMLSVSLISCGSNPAQNEPATTPVPNEPAGSTTVETTEATWDAKNIQLLIAAKAGGGTDVIGRIITQGMSEVSGKNVVVVNQTEGGGAVCFNNVATATDKADTMGFFIPSYFTSYISGVHDTSPIEDVKYPVTLECVTGANFWTVSADSPFNTIGELVDYIKAHPGEVTFGTQLGSYNHYQIADFCEAQGLEVQYLESGSDSDKVTGLMGNLFDVSTINGNQVNQYVEAGELKALMATGGYDEEMLTALAGIPVAEEAGYKPLRTAVFFSFAVPNSVPESVMAEISAAVEQAIAIPEVAEKCAQAGYEFKVHDYTKSNEYMEGVFNAYYSLSETLGLRAGDH